jgi:hypothetical protein
MQTEMENSMIKINWIVSFVLHTLLFSHWAFAQKAPPNEGPPSETVPAVSAASESSAVSNDDAPVPDPKELKRKIDEAARALSKEPSLAELRQAALRQADADKAPTDRWKRGVRLSSILPTLKVGADSGQSRDESLDRYQDDPDRWGADTERGFGADVSVQWKLDRLIFNTDELKVYDTLADRAVRRENLSTLLINVYFERKRLLLEEMLLPPEDVGDALERQMRIEELTETIDALTGGLLSQKLSPLKN